MKAPKDYWDEEGQLNPISEKMVRIKEDEIIEPEKVDPKQTILNAKWLLKLVRC